MLSLFSSYTFRFGFLTISSVIIALGSYGAQAADKNASKQPTQAEQAELEKFDSYSGPINILEPNANSEIHKFLENNDGKTVYLDTTIVRYIPIDPTYIDDPNIRASTDRFENPVFTKCWPDQRADYEGILNFGEEGFPLPKDDKDIEGGCASRIRFNLPNIKDVASIPTVWGDNKAQVFVNGFFSVAKSASGNGKTLYTLTPEKDVPNETKVIFDNHKSTQHPEAQLAFEKGKPELAK